MRDPFRSRERGQELVEFALTFPLLFLLLMGIFDMGRVVYYNSVLYNAAREGARYGVIYPDNYDEIRVAVRNMAVGLDTDPAVLVITPFHDEAADTIQVSLEYSFTLVTPLIGAFFGAPPLTLTNQATMRTEG